uniref:uncharacterized protein LOC122591762 n=1 Tax=Erigeron canadensis TaxID=72917 RepID=UPI001CB8E8D1|nr:uncharacterized protein LOC122591762 [Erigeron canadensis]
MSIEDKSESSSSNKPTSLHPAYSVTNIQTKIRTLDGTKWIYSTISDDFLVRVLEADTTARAAWVKLEKKHFSNKKARAAALETKVCNLTLAACSSLEDYFQRLKDLANQLEDVDHSVTDDQLVLQLVRGLPSEYDTTTIPLL